jgi:hypothetical protein
MVYLIGPEMTSTWLCQSPKPTRFTFLSSMRTELERVATILLPHAGLGNLGGQA